MAASWLTRSIARLLAVCKNRPAERQLRIEEQLQLGGRKSVTLLVCHGRRFLLAASGEMVTPLMEVQPPDPGGDVAQEKTS